MVYHRNMGFKELVMSALLLGCYIWCYFSQILMAGIWAVKFSKQFGILSRTVLHYDSLARVYFET